MRGDLRQSSLADVLRHLYAERKNGALLLSRAGGSRRIYFKKGAPVFADGPDKPFSTRQQAEGLLYSLFTWTSGEFSFEEGETVVEPGRAMTASPSAIILEGSRRIEDRATLEFLIGGPASVYACAPSSVLPLFTMKLLPPESAILAFARERTRFTIRDLPLPADELSTVSALNALVSVGLLEIVEKGKAPVPAPPVAAVPSPSTDPPPKPAPPSLAPAPPMRPAGAAPASPEVRVSPPPPAPPAPQVHAAPPAPPAPAPSAAPPPPAARLVEQVSPSPVVETRSDVEELLNTFEARRVRVPLSPPEAPRPAQMPLTARTMATTRPPSTTATAPSPPPVSAPEPETTDEPPMTTLPAGEAKVSSPQALAVPPAVELPDPSPDLGQEATPPSPPSEKAERVPTTPASSSSSRPWTAIATGWIPRGRTGAILAASIAVLLIAIVLGTARSSRRKERPVPDAVVSAESTVEEAESPVAPTESDPPTPPPEPPKESSDAELFYNANLAFENGDYLRSRAELEVLLARQPNFSAARDLLAKVERELAPKSNVEPPPPPPAGKTAERAPQPKPEPAPVSEPVKPAAPEKPDPAAVLDAARAALTRGDLATAEAKLDELEASSPSHPAAAELREELAERRWEKKLPIALDVRHDHALGGCDGLLSLTSNGFSYRSKEHEWVWSFAEVVETERRDPKRLRIETKARASFNFQLRSALSDQDWLRHQAIARR